MNKIVLRNFVTAVMVAGMLSACNLPGRDVPDTDTPIAPGEDATEPGDQPSSTATAAPTVTTLPTATIAPTATDRPVSTAAPTDASNGDNGSSGDGSSEVPADAQRLSFATGATQLTTDVSLDRQETASYVLRVSAGQLMDVSLGPDANVQLAVYGADGDVLKSGMGESSTFRGDVPSTQDYYVDVTAGSQAVSTTMTVIIPERITFDAGDTSADVEGELAAQSTHHYVMNAAANQFLEVSAGPQEDLQLVIYGADGTVLKSGMGEGAFFRGVVPTTQDYIVDVTTGSQPADYTMSVLIPERITFEAGAISAEVSGSLDATSSHTYVINAQAGQTMQVDLTPDDAVQTSIYGVDGSVMKSGMGSGPDFTGDLTISEDYFILVRSGPDATDYTMTVTIQ